MSHRLEKSVGRSLYTIGGLMRSDRKEGKLAVLFRE